MTIARGLLRLLNRRLGASHNQDLTRRNTNGSVQRVLSCFARAFSINLAALRRIEFSAGDGDKASRTLLEGLAAHYKDLSIQK